MGESESGLYKVVIGFDRLMMHNERLANPFDEYTQELAKLTHKRQKTLEEYTEIAKVEFQGGLYFDDKAGPYIPSRCINKAMVEGARRRKLGKAFAQAVMVQSILGPGSDVNPLRYEGPRTRKELWESGAFVDQRLVTIGKKRILRTRPLIRNCSCEFLARIVDSAVNGSDVETALDAAQTIGMLDGRPIYAGQYVLRKFEKVSMPVKKSA